MTDYEDKRMAGDYEVFQALGVGKVEIVMGENKTAEPGERYMCAFCVRDALLEQYAQVMVSDDYMEILELYSERIKAETENLRDELSKPEREGIDDRPVTKEGFIPITGDDDLKNKVILIRADVLKREYQRATHQFQLCTGGFGASPHSRGSACYCTNLYSGKESRYERLDVLGIVDKEDLPEWAKDGLKRAEKQRKRDKEAR